jgi:hypothetical protein
MGWGTLYEVSDGARELLHTCRSKADWYEALDVLGIQNSPQLNAEDSIRCWAAKLQSIGHPAEQFFRGDLHAEYDRFDDPNVCVVGSQSVRSFLMQLETLGKDFFVRLFPHDGPYGVGDSWLYEPLCSFLREVCGRSNAVVILWET